VRPIKSLSVLSQVLLFCLSSALVCAENSSQPAGAVDNLTRQATFIFVGTVARLNASTVSEVQASPAIAVVRVDDILEAPGAPVDLKGQEITVRLADPGSIKQAEKATFFTQGWLLGDSLAVVEIGHAAAGPGTDEVREQVSATHQKMADEALQGEIASAEAVVVGTVTSVKASSIPHIGSEHDPNWFAAEINATSVPKGALAGHTVTVLYPNSDDLMWQGAPRFKQGQQGIWLLHRNQVALPGIQNQFTALNPLDFQTADSLDRVMGLLKATR
jgi:hypothetical protein